MNEPLAKLWEIFSFPEAAILEKKIPKKLLIENAQLGVSEKRIIKENVDQIFWQYTLKSTTCPVIPYKDDERDYSEIAVLLVELPSSKSFAKIAESIHRAIPYPLLIVLTANDSKRLSLSVAPKRFSLAEKGAVVAEPIYTTPMLDMSTFSKNESDFLNSLRWSGLPLTHYFELYESIVDRFIAYECSQFSGVFKVEKKSDRIEILKSCKNMKQQIAELSNILKNADFNEQVSLNVKIKKKETELKNLIQTL